MRLTGIKGAICASLVALTAAASSASAAWPRYYYYSWGGYWPYNAWSAYSYSPWYASSYYPYYSGYSSYYPSYYTYNPYYYSYYPSYNTPAYTAPAVPATPAAVASTPSSLTYRSLYPPSTAVNTPPSNQATVVVRTAPDAKLWFNGVETSQTGAIRTFGTPELRPGEAYSYDVTVRWMENGTEMQRTRKVAVTPGEKVEVDLTPANLLKNG
jgi:uncharacterized protein (TIGR03000 family)